MHARHVHDAVHICFQPLHKNRRATERGARSPNDFAPTVTVPTVATIAVAALGVVARWTGSAFGRRRFSALGGPALGRDIVKVTNDSR